MAPVPPSDSTLIGNQTPVPSASLSSSNPHHVQTPPPLPSLEARDVWRESPQPALWDYRLDEDWHLFLAGENFESEAVSMSLLNATSGFLPAVETPLDVLSTRPRDSNLIVDRPVKQSVNSLQCKWHTFIEAASNPSQVAPDHPQECSRMDESHRMRLAERLQQRVQHGILPSSSFLVCLFKPFVLNFLLNGIEDLCMKAYFSRFHPLFPVVHIPTFRPSAQNSILLLSICSAGSLFVGRTRGLEHGISMFERLNKAMLASVYVSIRSWREYC